MREEMPLELAHRLSEVQASATLVLADRARRLQRAGHDIVSMTAGEPDFATPPHILAAIHHAIDEGHTRYTATAGIPELRAAIAADRSGAELHYGSDEVIVTVGAKQAIFNAIMALVGPGDEVLIPTPYWISYRDITQLASGTARFLHTHEEDGFLLAPDTLESAISPRSKRLILNSPSNPTGATYSASQLAKLAEILERYPRLFVLTDEIYRKVFFPGAAAPSLLGVAPQLKARTIAVDGCSKTYAMTGLRLGWALADTRIVEAMERIQGQSTTNASAPIQYGALAAIQGDQRCVEEMRATFGERARHIVRGLNALPGVRCLEPSGAFYAFPNVTGLFGRSLPNGERLRSATQLASHMLEVVGLAVVPGEPFGSGAHVRLSFATSDANIASALERFRRAIDLLKA